MRTLAAQGLVEIRSGQGIFVVGSWIDPTIDELANALLRQREVLADLFAVRRLLEPAAARWAAGRRGRDVERFETLLADMEAAGDADPPDYDAIGACDTQVHVEACSAMLAHLGHGEAAAMARLEGRDSGRVDSAWHTEV